MVRDRTCETACTSICRRDRREHKKDSTSRVHAITLHDLEHIEDEDENRSRLRVKRIWSMRGRVRGWVLLGDRTQWRWGCGISNLVKVVMHFFDLNSSRSAVGQLERICVVDITVDSTLELPNRVFFLPAFENPIHSAF